MDKHTQGQGTSLPNAKDSNLVIGANSAAPLSKAQKRFNMLVRKNQNLKERLEREQSALDGTLRAYATRLYPLEQELGRQRSEVLKQLLDYRVHGLTLNLKEQQGIDFCMDGMLEKALAHGLPIDGLEEVYRHVHGREYGDAVCERRDELLDNVRRFLEAHGIDPDLEGFDASMSEDEIMERFMELRRRMLEQAARAGSERKAVRKKGKRQLEKEQRAMQMEAAKKRNIGSIYKQLAKMLHPDLEQDGEKRRGKVALMQELTSAYERKDLHTLLRLELSFLKCEENHLAAMADSKLEVYNQLLNEQARELEAQLQGVYDHPRYDVLRRLKIVSYAGFDRSVREVEMDLETELDECGRILSVFGSPKEHREMKLLGKEYHELLRLSRLYEGLVRGW